MSCQRKSTAYPFLRLDPPCLDDQAGSLPLIPAVSTARQSSGPIGPLASGSWPHDLAATISPSADDFVAGEELRDFLLGGVRRIRAMHRVLTDRTGVNL